MSHDALNPPWQNAPAIFIWAQAGNQARLAELLWGIEEEGIPFRLQSPSAAVREPGNQTLAQLAHQAASLSPLAVGIASDGRTVVVHARNLPPSEPLFELTLDAPAQALRHLGSNAARLVKGLAFKPL